MVLFGMCLSRSHRAFLINSLARALRQPAFRLLLFSAWAGIALGQQLAKQDAAVLDTAKSIYRRTLTAVREAKTVADLQKLADELDSPEWISVDRFGRTGLTKQTALKGLESLLSVPPEHRVPRMEIIWAERDSDRLAVLAWMGLREVERVDDDGVYGEKGAKHRLLLGTMTWDLFMNTEQGWRRIRHEKLLPDSAVMAVDGTSRVAPPVAEQNRVTPFK